jgi:hypothetical protein
MFYLKQLCQIFYCVIDEMYSLSYNYGHGHPNLVIIYSYKNIVETTTILVLNAFAPTHLVV